MLQKCPSITSFPLYIHLIMESQNNPNFYSHHHQQPSSAVDINHHHQQQEFITTQQHYAKEHMFEKPLTPSDVGKLNRLVIPKQQAEKYFPLNDGVSTAGEQQKGMLLSFEDETGKMWWFRYSYWNSSQSYVLTKGWSRYVKDKHLDAGDVVLFERHMLDCERMFIRCRRRSAAVPVQDRMAAAAEMVVAQPVDGGGAHVSDWNTRVFYDAQSSYPSHHPPISLPFSYRQPNDLHAIAGDTFETVDNHQRGVVPTRRLRLFGVNLECPDNSEPSTSDGSSQGGQLDHQYNFSSNSPSKHDEIPPPTT